MAPVIEFRYSDTRSAAPAPSRQDEVLIGITADFEMLSDAASVYSELDFPIVELATALMDWLVADGGLGPDFEFDSMSTPEPGWVWIRRANGGWRLGSVNQMEEDPTVHNFAEVRASILDLRLRLDRDLRAQWGISLSDYTQN